MPPGSLPGGDRGTEVLTEAVEEQLEGLDITNPQATPLAVTSRFPDVNYFCAQDQLSLRTRC